MVETGDVQPVCGDRGAGHFRHAGIHPHGRGAGIQAWEGLDAREGHANSFFAVELAALKGIDINRRKAEFSSDLDIRGKRADEAITIISGFLDNAILFGTPAVRIIHGKGDGILREVLRNELRSYKEVGSFGDEHADRGGAGITVVQLAQSNS